MPSACLRPHVVPLPYSVGTFGLRPHIGVAFLWPVSWFPPGWLFLRVLRAGVGSLTPVVVRGSSSWCPCQNHDLSILVSSVCVGVGLGLRVCLVPRVPLPVVHLWVRLHHVFLYDVACCPPLLVGHPRQRQGATVRAGLCFGKPGSQMLR